MRFYCNEKNPIHLIADLAAGWLLSVAVKITTYLSVSRGSIADGGQASQKSVSYS
jgi:hypothetical protein